MADSESESQHSSPQTSPEAVTTLHLEQLAHVAHVPKALQEVVLPTPLRDLLEESGADARPDAPVTGSVIAGRYRLESVLGSGGMGVVFAARHLQTDKPVALKWLSLSRGPRGARERAQALARFAREARAAGRIRHPNVVDVYDASGDEHTPFLVMERLEGETLRSRLERAPLSWDELLRWLVPVMRGVAELHRQGIVHRDLKPDNVFLARQPGSLEPCAKVLDFGVSLLRSAEADEDSLTGTGAIVGTPAYMALEQLRAAENIDERTDVYALGVVLFEALTGKRPWQARSAGEYGALLASTRPARLSSFKPELKGAREVAIMKALEREPADRYPNVDAFIAALLTASRPRRASRVLWAAMACALAGLLVMLHSWRSQATGARASTAVQGATRRPSPNTSPTPAPLQRQAPVPEAVVDRPAAVAAPARPTAKGRRPSSAPRPHNPSAVPAHSRERRLDALSPFTAPPPQPVPQPTDRATGLARDEF